MTIIEFITFLGILAIIMITLKTLEVDKRRIFMGLNNATLVIVMQEFDKSSEIYYINQVYNPDTILKHSNYFIDNIMTSETFTNRKKAMERAREIEEYNPSTSGILVYDALSKYTYGEILIKMDGQAA